MNLGASEILLHGCTQFSSLEKEEIAPMTEAMQQKIDDEIIAIGSKGLRTLCIAFKEVLGDEEFNEKDDKDVHEIEKNNLILKGALSIRDILTHQRLSMK